MTGWPFPGDSLIPQGKVPAIEPRDGARAVEADAIEGEALQAQAQSHAHTGQETVPVRLQAGQLSGEGQQAPHLVDCQGLAPVETVLDSPEIDPAGELGDLVQFPQRVT